VNPPEAHPAKTTQLGELTIRRALPTRQRRLVGPWCFLDRFGPLTFQEEKPMDVAPHPHIGLQTVSWLLDGEILHDDSLGCEGLVRPGELNLMTAGAGIAHAEQTPPRHSNTLNGVQLWVALPNTVRGMTPAFHHYTNIPACDLPGGHAALLIGDWNGQHSPALAYSPMLGADLSVHPAQEMQAPLDRDFEHALLVLQGEASLEGQRLQADTLYYLEPGRNELSLRSSGGARVMLIGGRPFGETVMMWWNFVARTREELASAREDWQQHRGFGEVAGYQGARIEAPPFIPRASGA
jgi:quercetin 2,3-dioxygenase